MKVIYGWSNLLTSILNIRLDRQVLEDPDTQFLFDCQRWHLLGLAPEKLPLESWFATSSDRQLDLAPAGWLADRSTVGTRVTTVVSQILGRIAKADLEKRAAWGCGSVYNAIVGLKVDDLVFHGGIWRRADSFGNDSLLIWDSKSDKDSMLYRMLHDDIGLRIVSSKVGSDTVLQAQLASRGNDVRVSLAIKAHLHTGVGRLQVDYCMSDS